MRTIIKTYAPYLLAVIFFLAGFSKLIGFEAQLEQYRHWNFPIWLMRSIGAIEVIVAALLLFGRTRFAGLAGVIFTMVGAILTLIIGYNFEKTALPAAFLLLAFYLAAVHRSGTDGTFAAFRWVVALSGSLLAAGFLLWGHGPTPPNSDRERETLPAGTPVTHHFQEVDGIRWHYVSAGESGRESVVLLNGFPESWWAYQNQISALADEYYVVAVDLKPYGQTDKDLDGDHSYPAIARELAALLNEIGVRRFNLIGHDRGSVVADHLIGQIDTGRVLRYIRMQQSANEAHGDPKPPHALMGSLIGTLVARSRLVPLLAYSEWSPYVHSPLDAAIRTRLQREFQFRGTAQAVALSFKTTAWDNELADRVNRLFKKMTMPTLILQGRHDPGQRPAEYERTAEWLRKGRVQFIEAGHFLHLERPLAVNRAILSFLKEN